MTRIKKNSKIVTIRELFESGKLELDEKVIVTEKLTPSFVFKEEYQTLDDLMQIVNSIELGSMEVDMDGQILFYSGLVEDTESFICELDLDDEMDDEMYDENKEREV
jgi:hypothetical protein